MNANLQIFKYQFNTSLSVFQYVFNYLGDHNIQKKLIIRKTHYSASFQINFITYLKIFKCYLN